MSKIPPQYRSKQKKKTDMPRKSGDPPKRGKKKTPAQKAAASRAKNVKKAQGYVAKGKKVGEKSKGKHYSPKRKTQVKGMAQATTADNLIKEGTRIIKSGGQGTLKKKRTLKVTPRSIVRTDTAKSKDLQRQKKGAGRATTRRPKRK